MNKTIINSKNNYLKHGLSYIILIIAALFFLFPIYWMITTSLKESKLAFSDFPVWFFKITLENFQVILYERGFANFLANSIIVTIFSTILTIILGGCIAFSVTRFRVIGSKFIMSWILSLRMIPPITAVVPIYLLAKSLNILDTYLVLILIYTFMNLPIAVWLIKSFLGDIPQDLEEAARIDGCSHVQAFIRITLPLAMPGIIATAIICIIFAWNEFLYANILTGTVAKTAPVALTAYATPVSILWGQIFASGTLVILPVTIVGLIFQKYLVRGLTLGALKE